MILGRRGRCEASGTVGSGVLAGAAFVLDCRFESVVDHTILLRYMLVPSRMCACTEGARGQQAERARKKDLLLKR